MMQINEVQKEVIKMIKGIDNFAVLLRVRSFLKSILKLDR